MDPGKKIKLKTFPLNPSTVADGVSPKIRGKPMDTKKGPKDLFID